MNEYRPRPDIRPGADRFADLERSRQYIKLESIKPQHLTTHGITDYAFYGVSKYDYCLYGATGIQGTLNFAVYA